METRQRTLFGHMYRKVVTQCARWKSESRLCLLLHHRRRSGRSLLVLVLEEIGERLRPG